MYYISTQDGAKEVIPVLHHDEALELAKDIEMNDFLLAGEIDAKPITGFIYPSPNKIRNAGVRGKTLLLSTTNGTVALRRASSAEKVYVSSLINNLSVAKQVQSEMKDHTILVICSGNAGEFSLEDFYGAGHFIDSLIKTSGDHIELTDAAKAALYFYRGNADNGFQILLDSYVGRLFEKYHLLDELLFASSIGKSSVIPVLEGNKVVVFQPFSANELILGEQS